MESNNKPLHDVYVAGPYTDTSSLVRAQRYDQLTYYAGVLMREGLRVASPITHSHPIALAHELPEYTDWWMRQDAPFLLHSKCVHVVNLHGVGSSDGVRHEVKLAKDNGIPVYGVEVSSEHDLTCCACGKRFDYAVSGFQSTHKHTQEYYCPQCWIGKFW